MNRINKLKVNTEKLLKNEELLSLRGGNESADCPCGTNGQETRTCSIWLDGVFAFSGIACGSQEYILSLYPPSQGWTVSCGPSYSCNTIPI